MGAEDEIAIARENDLMIIEGLRRGCEHSFNSFNNNQGYPNGRQSD